MIKGKKAFLLGEFTLKVIMAVLSLTLLLYLLFTIYGIYQGNEKIREAESTLDLIIETIEQTDESDTQTTRELLRRFLKKE